MKKTIIALMALAGVAMADTYTASEVNSWLTTAGNTVGGSKYTLTFTFADTYAPGYSNFAILEMATLNSKKWSIYQQDGRYLGLGDGDEPNGNYASRNDVSVNNIDTDTAGKNNAAVYSGWFYDSGELSTALAGATFTIASATGNTDITFTTADKSRTISLNRSVFLGTLNSNKAGDSVLKFTNGEFSDVSVAYDGGTLTIPPHPTPAVPEPTTATLSLLALVGMAARRRRH